MKTVIEKSKLLSILEDNRSKHQGIFEEAVEGYRREAVKQLEGHIDRIKRGSLVQIYVSMPKPENHMRDYERVIKMVELHQGGTLELTEGEVGQYIMDDWSWKRQFLASNSAYSATAQASLGDE